MPTVTLGVLAVVFGLDMIACLAAVADQARAFATSLGLWEQWLR